MSRTNRRSMLQLALVAAVAPMALAPARALAADRLIAPPGRQMRYTRRVMREMADGAQFTVTREFAVEFRRFAGGFTMFGSQQSVVAEAPPVLARFVEIEEGRDESGLFPLTLDPFGQIVSAEIAPLAGEGVGLAVDEGLAALRSQRLPDDEQAQLAAFVAAIRQASQRVTAHLPADLFAPVSASRREERRIALPGGGEGSVSAEFGGVCDGRTGLMRSAERAIVTMLGNSSRSQREQWTLTEV